MKAEAPPRPLAELYSEASSDMEKAIALIRRIEGYGDFLKPPEFKDMVAAARPGAPLCYLVSTEHGSLALLVESDGRVSPVWVDGFTESDLRDLLLQRDEQGVMWGYLVGQLWGLGQWMLQEALETVGQKLIGPLAGKLKEMEAEGVVLIPGGHLALLPFHAARYQVDGKGTYLLDEFDVYYAPGARPYREAQGALAEAEKRAQVLAGVGDPQPVFPPLKFARAELEEIEKLFPEGARRTLYEKNATKTAFLEKLPGASHVHFSCHGRFDPVNPLASCLELGDKEDLTLKEMLDGKVLAGVRLAALSACQTAITDFNNLPDEAIGLPAGVLQAGAVGVVGTLWSVEEISTAILLVKFYENYLVEGMPPVRALRMAQIWMRDSSADEKRSYVESHRSLKEAIRDEWGSLKPFNEPEYWAPFMFAGM